MISNIAFGMMESQEDILQWVFIIVLLSISFTTLGLSISNARMGKKLREMTGSVQHIEKTYERLLKKLITEDQEV